MALKINQADNYQANFGCVLRSSAIFYYRHDQAVRTTISFMNYWSMKRHIQVTVVASLRHASGRLVRRDMFDFSEAPVVNYSPVVEEGFEGSVEIEVFALKSLVIPYAAIMAVYETANGISMVHSYTRTYAPHEIEEGRTITLGQESCWSIRDSRTVRSFGVFHNGGHRCPGQLVRLVVTNALGEQGTAEFELPELHPYQTVIVRPGEYLPDLETFLQGQPGNAALSFQLTDGFTRMLVGNETCDQRDMQVTHSNFNYSIHRTDTLSGGKQAAFMTIPHLPEFANEVVVYPDSDPGEYIVETGTNGSLTFAHGRPLAFPLVPSVGENLVFRKVTGELPSRIVTALRVQPETGVLPAECSLGVIHDKRPPKRFWWGLCGGPEGVSSRLIATYLPEIYGDASSHPIHLKLYSARQVEPLDLTLSGPEQLLAGVPLTTLFPEANDFLGDGYGWFTLYSDYPGYFLYTTLEKTSGSISLEHGF